MSTVAERNNKPQKTLDLRMWGKALTAIPHISQEEWAGMDVIARWLVASRAAVLVITLIPAVIAGILAARDGRFNWGLWLLVTIGLLMAHAMNNIVNDLVSLPYALGATSVIFGKHIVKFTADKAKAIRTLPVLLGERLSRYLAIGMMLAQYVLVLALIVSGYFTLVMLIVLLAGKALTLVLSVYNEPRPETPPEQYPQEAWPLWFVSFAFVHNRSFGLWFMAGLIVDSLLQTWIL